MSVRPFNRRSATNSFSDLIRGLKPTATITASLREAERGNAKGVQVGFKVKTPLDNHRMRRSAIMGILIGCFTVIGLILGCYFWLQNNSNSNYIAAKCEQMVKSRCRPEDLQSWATNLVARSQEFTNARSTSIPVPGELKTIWKHRPAVFIREAREGSESYVYLFWGSGVLGHWGLSIGSSSFVPAAGDRQGAQSEQWRPGIYFWRDCH